MTTPTVITLTLPMPENGGIVPEHATATLLIQRGDLAHLNRFAYTRIADLTEIIADALVAFAALEADPPVISDMPPPAHISPIRAKQPASSPPPAEPTVDIPLKKGKKAVRISHLKITGGETNAAAYRQAVQLAAILIDGKLWDGETPIRIPDVYALAKKMKYMTPRDMVLFKLTDFVEVGEAPTPADPE